MATDDFDRCKLVVGLANYKLADEVHNVLRHTTGSPTAVTISPNGGTGQLVLGGVTTSVISFFGVAGRSQATAAAVTDFASLKVALQSYGIVGA